MEFGGQFPPEPSSLRTQNGIEKESWGLTGIHFNSFSVPRPLLPPSGTPEAAGRHAGAAPLLSAACSACAPHEQDDCSSCRHPIHDIYRAKELHELNGCLTTQRGEENDAGDQQIYDADQLLCKDCTEMAARINALHPEDDPDYVAPVHDAPVAPVDDASVDDATVDKSGEKSIAWKIHTQHLRDMPLPMKAVTMLLAYIVLASCSAQIHIIFAFNFYQGTQCPQPRVRARA